MNKRKKICRDAKGKEVKHKAGEEGTEPLEQDETKAEEAQKTESVDNDEE
jgi:high-mobility group nucleosome-binding domain-containing protein 3